ncbi:MAG: MFS transporter [Actinobacteria bacterium]|nr:MFS transporter [Actinomycetota bacterium]
MTSSRPGRPGGEPPPAVERIAWRPASLGVLVIAVTILPAFLTGALGVQIGDELGIDLAGIGGLYGVLFGTSAVFSAPAGRFVQHRGWEAGIRIAAGGTGVALAVLAVLPSRWWAAWWPVALIFVGAGVTAAISQTGSNLALAVSVPPSRYGLAFGFKHTAVPVAAMLGGLAVPTIALPVGWRWAYAAAAGFAFATALAVPARHGPPPPPRKTRALSRPTATPTRTLVALAGAAMLSHTGLDAMGAFVVPFAVSVGVAEGSAGILLTIGSLAGLTMRLVSGWLVDRRQHTGLPWMAALLAAGSLGFLVLAIGGRPLLVAGVLLAFAGAWGWAGLLTFVVVRANPGAPAAATGIANTGKYIGADAGPALLGYLAERVSFSAAWGVACGLLALSAVIVTVIRLTPSGIAMADPPAPGAA